MHTLHSNTKSLGGSRDNMWLMTLWHLSCSALWCIGLCCALGSKRERMRGMEGNRNDGRTDGRKDGRREEDEVGEYALPCRAEKFHGCPSRNSVWVWEVYTSNVVVGMWRLEQVSNLRNKKELSGIWACSVRNGNQRLSILLHNLSMPRIPTLNTCPFGSFVFARGLSLLGGGGSRLWISVRVFGSSAIYKQSVALLLWSDNLCTLLLLRPVLLRGDESYEYSILAQSA